MIGGEGGGGALSLMYFYLEPPLLSKWCVGGMSACVMSGAHHLDLHKSKNKQIFFKSNHLCWIDLLIKKEWKQDSTHVDHSQLDPLPLEIIFTKNSVILNPWCICF